MDLVVTNGQFVPISAPSSGALAPVSGLQASQLLFVDPAVVEKLKLFAALAEVTTTLEAGLTCTTPELGASLAELGSTLEAGMEERGKLEATLSAIGGLSASMEEC